MAESNENKEFYEHLSDGDDGDGYTTEESILSSED